jgi:hypothetical protein
MTSTTKYKLPKDSIKGRRRVVRGADKRMWRLIDWQVVCGYQEPRETMVYENYVPCEVEDVGAYLLNEYGPFGSDIFTPRCIWQVR